MITLDEIINAMSPDVNTQLRRAFRPLSPEIDITGSENHALVILVNLTEKVDKQKDLLDREKCRQMLRDDKWWFRCINTVYFRQSHNVKFPQLQAEGVIRAQPLGDIPKYLLSSSKLEQKTWTYAKDSKDVNIASFLTSDFIYRDSVSCLGILLSDIEHPLWEHLCKLGCYQKTRKIVAKQLKEIENYCIDVPLGNNSVRQISLPDTKGSYLSLSPVTSQSMQNECYHALFKQYRLSKVTRYSRATNMGVLPMSCGGALRSLSKEPSFSRTKHNNPRKQHWLDTEGILAFKSYFDSYNWVLSASKIKKKREHLESNIQSMISRWLEDNPHPKGANTSELVQSLNFDLSKTRALKQFAYEPSTTRLLLRLLEKVPRTKDSALADENDDANYLLMPNISVCGASAMSTAVTIGLPSMTAFFGFVHAFERNIQRNIPHFKVESFALCIHEMHLQNRGMTREYVTKPNGKVSAPATCDDWQCDFKASIILKINHTFDIDPYQMLIALPKRLASGCARISLSNIESVQISSDFQHLVEQIPNQQGQWLSLLNENLESFDAVLQQLTTHNNVTPNCIGYHYLEEPRERPSSLRGYKHVFAEPIIGIIKLSSINTGTLIHDVLWHQNCNLNYTSIETGSISNEITY